MIELDPQTVDVDDGGGRVNAVLAADDDLVSGTERPGQVLAEVEEIIHSTGFYRNKTKSLLGMAEALVERFDGEVPGKMSDLVSVPGVGRKTAERLLVEMRGHFRDAPAGPAGGATPEPREEALHALLALGYKPQEASRAVSAIKEEGLSSEELIRRALKGMG